MTREDEEYIDPDVARLANATWWVMSPLGPVGPYPEAAKLAGGPLGFRVFRRLGPAGGAR